jgi:group I intron endonuclease
MIAIPTTSGIYRITCTVTGKFYIGSAINLHKRRRDHFRELQQNSHRNRYLQRAFNKYGEQAFTFEVLELVLPISLTAREQYWLDKLKPFGRKGFNIAPTAGSTLGCVRPSTTFETRTKMSKSQTGRTHSTETIEKMRISARMRPPRSHETYLKWSAGHIGKPAHNRGKKLFPKVTEQFAIAHEGEMKTLIVIAPDGTEQTIHGIKKFCREHQLNPHSLNQVARGKQSHHKGWKARSLNE